MLNKKQIKECANELSKVMKKVADNENFLNDNRKAENYIESYEFSIGGETIHRGYYCPSLILDKVIGGCYRGKMNEISKFGEFTYQYGFNKDGKLLQVKEVNEFTTISHGYPEEYFLYEDNIVTSYLFDHQGKFIGVSKCVYDNSKNLTSYELYYKYGSIVKYTKEEYIYNSDTIYANLYFYDGLISFMSSFRTLSYEIKLDDDLSIDIIYSLKDNKKNKVYENIKKNKYYTTNIEEVEISLINLFIENVPKHIEDLEVRDEVYAIIFMYSSEGNDPLPPWVAFGTVKERNDLIKKYDGISIWNGADLDEYGPINYLEEDERFIQLCDAWNFFIHNDQNYERANLFYQRLCKELSKVNWENYFKLDQNFIVTASDLECGRIEENTKEIIGEHKYKVLEELGYFTYDL